MKLVVRCLTLLFYMQWQGLCHSLTAPMLCSHYPYNYYAVTTPMLCPHCPVTKKADHEIMWYQGSMDPERDLNNMGGSVEQGIDCRCTLLEAIQGVYGLAKQKFYTLFYFHRNCISQCESLCFSESILATLTQKAPIGWVRFCNMQQASSNVQLGLWYLSQVNH